MNPDQRLRGHVDASASLVWRFVHLIDQTVNTAAGITQAATLAAVQADYARAAASGGRFNGDIVTSDPAVVVP